MVSGPFFVRWHVMSERGGRLFSLARPPVTRRSYQPKIWLVASESFS